MNWTRIGKSQCPVARALAMVGDRWTLLILRELFVGVPRFEDIQAETGVSSHLLSMRLRKLEINGILIRKQYSKRPVRYEYRLTAKGNDIVPILTAFIQYGIHHHADVVFKDEKPRRLETVFPERRREMLGRLARYAEKIDESP